MAAWDWVLKQQWAGLPPNAAEGTMAVWGGYLWINISAGGGTWYTADGVNWTQDLTVPFGTAQAMDVWNGDLYVAVNDMSVGHTWNLYRLDGDGWALVATITGTTDGGRVTKQSVGTRDGHYIMFGGWRDVAGEVNQDIRIWKYDGVSVTLDFAPAHVTEYFNANDLIWSAYEGRWYCSTRNSIWGGADGYVVLRRDGENNWVADTTVGGWKNVGITWYRYTGGRFAEHFGSQAGIYVLVRSDHYDILYKPRDGLPWQWATDSDIDPAHTHLYEWAAMTYLVSDVGYDHVYYKKPDATWEDTGALPNCINTDDIIQFNNNLYVCGDINTTTYGVWGAPLLISTGFGLPPGDARSLMCDHQFGDTIYLGLRDPTLKPIILWVDWDFEDYYTGYRATAGSTVGVMTVEIRNTCFGYGNFGANKQVIRSEDKLVTWNEAMGEFGSDVVTTMEYHPTSGSDFVATRRDDQDLIRTETGGPPWTDLGLTPFVARSQLRVQDHVWIGSDTGGSSPVRMYDLTGGSWADKSNGLPAIAINDLELGY